MHSELEIQNLNLTFSKNPFFSNLHMSLEKGKLHSLKGKNGSGKSTLFKALRGDLDSQTQVSGMIRIAKNSYSFEDAKSPYYLKKQVALVSQSFDSMIANQFSFSENLRFANFSRFPSLINNDNGCPSIPSFVDRFGINPDMPAYLLSGGQRQILTLVMVLQKNPSILLLDEPTAALDSTNASMVFEFINELTVTRNITALVISHDQDLLNEYCTGNSFELRVDPKTHCRDIHCS